jgi:hypothetical protein
VHFFHPQFFSEGIAKIQPQQRQDSIFFIGVYRQVWGPAGTGNENKIKIDKGLVTTC